jgi:protein required for attachment to host cells
MDKKTDVTPRFEDAGPVAMRTGIVTADATRARLYTFDELTAAVDEPTQELRERVTLVDPARRRRASELFSDTRPGLDRAPSGRGFAVDDRRDAALRRMDREFAGDIAQACVELMRSHRVSRLIVAASPRMLGFLRELGPLAAADVELCEIDRDLVHLSNAQLHDYLANRDLLPARERVGLAAQA